MPLRPNMQPAEYVEIFRRRKWLIIFSILSILFGAGVYCVVTPEQFRSSTTILVIPQRVPENYVRSTVSVRMEERLATIRQQVMSRTRIIAVMEELGLFKEERRKGQLDDLVEGMRKRINIEVRNNDAFTLSFIHSDRQMAMLTTSRLASFFIEENLKSREQQAVGTADFLDSQLQETKKKLEQQEELVRRYKSTFMGELPQQLQANLQVLSRLQDQLRVNSDSMRTAQERKIFAESQIAALESQLANMEAQATTAMDRSSGVQGQNVAPLDPVSPLDPAAPYLPEMNSKKTQLSNLSSKYTSQYPEIRRLKEEIGQLEKRVIEARKSSFAPNSDSQANATSRQAVPILAGTRISSFAREKEEIRRQREITQGLGHEIQSLKKERADIQKNIGAIEEKVARSPKREQEMIGLTRDYENLRRSYDELLRKKLDAELSQNLEKRQKGEQFQILDPANLPEEPFAPNRPRVFGVGVLAALLFGFGGAIALEIFDPSVRGVKEFRHYSGLSVLASIPGLRTKAYSREIAIRKATVVGGFVVLTTGTILFLFLYGEKVRAILQGVK